MTDFWPGKHGFYYVALSASTVSNPPLQIKYYAQQVYANSPVTTVK